MKIIDVSDAEMQAFYTQLGKAVKKLRKAKGLTQTELALSINHNSVGHVAKAELYKYGKHFSLEQLYKISKVLEIPLSEILAGVEQEDSKKT